MAQDDLINDLSSNRDLLVSMIRAIPDGVMIINSSGVILFITDAACEIIGMIPEHMGSGRTILEFLDPGSIVLAGSDLREVLSSNRDRTGEYRIKTETGELRWIEAFSTRIEYKGAPAALIVMRNITRRRAAERERAASELRYRTYVELSPGGIFIADQNGRFIDLNQSACTLLEYGRDELLNLGISDITPPEYREEVYTRFRERVSAGSSSGEIELVTRLGKRIQVILSTTRLPDGSMMGFCTDITTRKKMEAELKESEIFNRELIENLPDLIIVYDLSPAVTYVNPAACRAFRMSPDELIGSNPANLVAEYEKDRVNEYIRRRAAGDEVEGYEIDLKDKDGRIFTVITKGVPISFHRQIGFLLLLIDITERKKAEDEVELAKKALAEVNKKLNVLSTVTRTVILNKVSSLLVFLDLANQRIRDPILKEYLKRMEEAAEGIQEQIAFTRFYEDIGMQAPQWQSLERMITAHIFRGLPPYLTLVLNVSRIMVYADPQLSKVFINLIQNSLQHGGRITRIEISAVKTTLGLLITYLDDGIGIPPDEKESIFERGTAKDLRFGLFLTREILSITGITIVERGEYEKGARFDILVPEDGYKFHDSLSRFF
ncbi:MAG TPA: PAS domain S-box protein [Methanospirillum sp.]|nr:PAS domain S-box protein [Methanospirillum sp.]